MSSIPSPSDAAASRTVPGVFGALVRQLRPHQWSKNVLVLVAPLLAPGLPDPASLARGAVAALTLSLCASAGYVLNDLLDIEADRAHRTKRTRPFASGALPAASRPPLGVGLVAASFVDSAALRSGYREPAVLWLALPLLLYWIGRIWLLAGGGLMHDDPVRFALQDRQSLICGACMAGLAAVARFPPAWLIPLFH